jgi:hypothetical protein
LPVPSSDDKTKMWTKMTTKKRQNRKKRKKTTTILKMLAHGDRD